MLFPTGSGFRRPPTRYVAPVCTTLLLLALKRLEPTLVHHSIDSIGIFEFSFSCLHFHYLVLVITIIFHHFTKVEDTGDKLIKKKTNPEWNEEFILCSSDFTGMFHIISPFLS
jgi:hypothetical protein